jgi:tetratricopeptide (TPR) repeat protein
MVRWRRALRMAWLWSVLLAWILASSAARADVVSQVAYARGLVAFHQAQWNEAIAAFDEALGADPQDARARYYRGLARARVGDTGGAVEDIEAALRLQPDLPHAWLDLGIAYLSAGRLADARTALERAVERGHERHVAEFFLGLVLYRLGERDRAATLLQQAQVDPEVRLPAAYYTGLIAVQQGAPERARSLLEGVAREVPNTEIGVAAARYLSGGEVSEPQVRQWRLHGRVGFEYDTNVTLGPSSVTIATPRDITEQSDGRIVVAAGAQYRFLENSPFSLSASYDFSQSVHFDLTAFDLQGHRLALSVAGRRDPWSYGLSGGYNFFALNYQTFFHEGLATPWLTYHWSDSAATQAFVAFRGRDFLRRPYDPGRDARNYAPGVRQYLRLGATDRLLALGYQYEIEDTVSSGPQGRTFAYRGHVLDTELHWRIAERWLVNAGYAYRRYDYENVESGFGLRKRKDDGHQFALGVAYPLSDHVAWTFGYIGHRHDSNVSLFEYDRHIVSTALELVY